ncbi:hypothetical protein [Peribacillus muralis]|uniref:hypothetical protein n=1 Tax=Peribacillus muralis TaxID=264697 RepID=UPI00366CC945
MGDIIDFFLGNPFLIIILIGIVSSMLGRKKKLQENEAPNGPPKKKWQEVMRELQGDMQGNQQQGPAPAPVRKVGQQAPQAAEIIDETKNEANKRIAELRRLQQKYDQERLYQKAKADSITISAISDNRSTVYHKGPSFGKKQLIDGIIMSEVLGPPRAKRSLQRSRR